MCISENFVFVHVFLDFSIFIVENFRTELQILIDPGACVSKIHRPPKN